MLKLKTAYRNPYATNQTSYQVKRKARAEHDTEGQYLYRFDSVESFVEQMYEDRKPPAVDRINDPILLKDVLSSVVVMGQEDYKKLIAVCKNQDWSKSDEEVKQKFESIVEDIDRKTKREIEKTPAKSILEIDHPQSKTHETIELVPVNFKTQDITDKNHEANEYLQAIKGSFFEEVENIKLVEDENGKWYFKAQIEDKNILFDDEYVKQHVRIAEAQHDNEGPATPGALTTEESCNFETASGSKKSEDENNLEIT